MSIKLHLKFLDRIGIVADISRVIVQHGLSIVSMEVVQKNLHAHVYLEVDMGTQPGQRSDIFPILSSMPGLEEISCIDTLPHEERENLLRVVLDNISEGIIAVDAGGLVTMMNTEARRTLGCEGREVAGEPIHSFSLPDYSILESLQGKTFHNVKKSLVLGERGERRVQYFASDRPIRNGSGRIIGAVEIAKDAREIQQLAKTLYEPDNISFSDIVGQSPAFSQAIAFATRIAPTDSIILIRGESGTGKDLFAQAIHAASGRQGQFVAVNCAAVPEQLLESELFGYAGGTFTGGRKEGRQGLIEAARGGTVFLDEISEMPLASQAKILRLIQNNRLRRLGDSKEIPADVRIIAAANRNLEEMVERKSFREDLYYRINVLPIHLPPLRERTEDLPLLAEHFLFRLVSRLGKDLQSFSQAALDKLREHRWPGNVRELKNVVERAAILCDSVQIGLESILLGHEIGHDLSDLKGQLGSETGRPSLKALLDRYERTVIQDGLRQHKSIRQTARALGLSHTALRNKLKKFSVET